MTGRWMTALLMTLALLSGCCDGEPAEETKPAVEAVTEAPEVVTEEPVETTRAPAYKRREARETPRPDARDVDKAVSRWIGTEVGDGRLEDVEPDDAARIDLIQEDGADVVNLIEVDLDRDGSWDERWTIQGASVTREVSPDDDGDYSQRFAWIMQRWINT